VHLVFNGTKSGLNNVIWAPSFTLLTIDSLLPMLEPGTWQGGINVEEQFYNYLLYLDIQSYCGVDVNPYLASDQEHPHLAWIVWVCCCVMGLRSSPHGCMKMQALAEEILRGNSRDTINPFYYDLIHLNLPGDTAYYPNLPWFSKIDTRTGAITADMATYVDDAHTTGATDSSVEMSVMLSALVSATWVFRMHYKSKLAPVSLLGLGLGLLLKLTQAQFLCVALRKNGTRPVPISWIS
jgi:hypothetical protein